MRNNYLSKLIVCLMMYISIFLPSMKAYANEVLFSIPYGEEADQVYMYIPFGEGGEATGPGFFFIDIKHNVVYIDLQKFKPNGEFIEKIQPEEIRLLENLGSCSWVDSEENIYTVRRDPIYKYDRVVKLDKEGKLIWTKSLPEIVANDNRYKDISYDIKVDTQGNVYFKTYFKARPEDEIGEYKYLKLDKEGNSLGEIPSYYFDKNGNYYVFQPIESEGKLYGTVLFGESYVGNYESGANIEIFNPEKQFMRRITVALPEEFKQLVNYRRIDQWEVDPEGNIYACANVLRDKDKIEELSGEDFSIDSDNIIYKFNQRGELLSQITFLGDPISMNKKIQVDETGNIYYLQFYADHLDVVKVSSDNIAPQTNISITPFPNIAGWNNSDITITLTATDNEGGSGVKEIHYTLTGAVNEDKVVPGQTAQIVLKTEGTTTISYYTLDNTGNKDETKSLILNLDKTAPLVSLNLEPYKIKLPFRHETHHFYTPFFYKLTYSASDSLSGIKGSKTGLITPNINGFRTQLIKGKQLHITVNVDKKHVIIIAPNPQQVLDQLKSNLLIIDNSQVMHLNQRPKAKGWMINKTDKFLIISAPSIIFKTEASDNADNLARTELKYEKKKIPLPDHCKLMINRKEFSQEELEDLMEDMNVDTDTMKNIHKNYKVK